jgi:hypothetical protein
MTWLRRRTTLEWTALQYYMYKKCWWSMVESHKDVMPPRSVIYVYVGSDTVGLTFGVVLMTFSNNVRC